MIFVLLLLMPALTHAQDESTPPAQPPEPEVEVLRVNVLDSFPHDVDAFTQGLVFAEDGLFYESTGLYGESDLRQVEPETGEVLEIVDVPDAFFAEGLALVDDRLIQITWRENTAFVYDFETFEIVDEFSYDTEGWGLCYDGEFLYMSDGTPNLYVRDPETFELIQTLPIVFQGRLVTNTNELECAGDELWANIWTTDIIVRIDKLTGFVTAVVDAQGLLTPEEYADLSSGAVLNGIAYNPESETFYITGKLWPRMFEVTFEPFDPQAEAETQE